MRIFSTDTLRKEAEHLFDTKTKSIVIISITVLFILTFIYALTQRYIADQAEKRVRDTTLQYIAFHKYVQQGMHPAYYKLKKQGILPHDFYAPEMLSSSFITRNVHDFLNQERREHGLPEISYKITSTDPRNPVNKATPYEQKLITMFNKDRSRTSHREIIEENGKKFLLYAHPFLEVHPRCLNCHGAPEDAPPRLRERYDWTGAWNLEVGDIIAAEIIKTPLEGEYNPTMAIMGGAVVILGGALGLILLNRRLQVLVARRTEALQHSEAQRESMARKYAAVMNSTNDAVLASDLEGFITVFNPAAEKLLQCSAREALGTPLSRFCPPHLLEEQNKCLERVSRTGHLPSFETERQTAKGEIVPVEMTLSLNRDSEGRPRGYSGIIRDITERTRLMEEKKQVEEQYRQAQKVESIGRLAGGVAHDLNNLLTPILGYSELLQNAPDLSDARRKTVGTILGAGLRARDLVQQLLAFSRKQTLAVQPVNLNEVIRNFEKLLRRTIREDVEITFKPAWHISTVMADIRQIEQVLMNLCINAADAMPGGGQLILETGMADLDERYTAGKPELKAGRYVLVAVNDTGCGMDREVRKNIFEPFFSTKGEHGTGLGLATVYGIVKQHRGHINVYSEPGKGTRFTIYLPVSDMEHTETETNKTTGKYLKGSETILLVEDNEQVREMMQEALEDQGYTLFVAENGTEALSILESCGDKISLLLTDVIMPGMNGKELYEQAAQTIPDLKVMYMSGYSDSIIAHHGVLDKNFQGDAIGLK